MSTPRIPPNQCISKSAKGYRCGNASLPDTEYCYVHTIINHEAVKASAELASQAHVETIKTLRKGSINSIDDVIALQSRILSQLARKPNLSTKELLVFNSLSTNYIKNKMEAEKMKRLVELEKKTSHI